MHVFVAILAALVLTGCGWLQRRGGAPVGDAEAQCYMQCTPSLTDTGVRWEGDAEAPEAWDELGQSVVPALAGRLLQCERRRQACTDFLKALKQRGAYRAKD